VNDKETLKGDIEKAERMILIVSWLGTISAFAVVGYSFWSMM